MELRSCSNLHFIQSVKGGSVVKALNVNRGGPALTFKKMTEIYEALDAENPNYPFLQPKDEFDGLRTVRKRILISDPDVSEFSCSDDDDERNSDEDDLGLDKMTLKQLIENSKAKKRERSKLVNSRTAELRTLVKLETNDDECDLMKPLIAWKSKVSKKVKAKGKYLQNSVSPPCQSATSTIKVEQNQSDQDFIKSEGTLPAAIKVKVEVPELDCSDGQNRICFSGDPHLIFDNQVDSCGVLTDIATECDLGVQASVSDSQNEICFEGDSSLVYENQVNSCGLVHREVIETTAECAPETQSVISLTEESQYCVASEVYHEYTEHSNSEPVQIVESLVDSCGIVAKDVTEMATAYVLGTEKLISLTEETQYCVVNETRYEYREEPVQLVSALFDDTKKVENPEINNHQSDLSESTGEGFVDQPVCAGIFREPMFPNCDCSSDVHNDFSSPSTTPEIPGNVNSNTALQIPDVASPGCLQDIESSHGSDACAPDDNAKDDLPSNPESSAIYSSDGKYNSPPHCWFVPSVDDSPKTEEKPSQESSSSEELTTSDGSGYDHDSNLNRPQRLLSTRKAISPDSQEKLCQAMDSIELQDEEHYTPQKKLCFVQQSGKETKFSAAEKSNQISRVRFISSHNLNLMKQKNEKRHGEAEDSFKGRQLCEATPRFSSGFKSIESCSQSAIAFSQRQMQDIECLATKLTNELKTMKEIAEDRLYSEACPATTTPFKYKANEVRTAVRSAKRVEQLATRWLAMMSRDCSRFCKIMRLSDKDLNSGGPVKNKRKRITFADEAGEKLCHVRVFRNDTTSSVEPVSENPELLY